ncbi:MAG: PTS sugar transporter subunit IIA [Cellulosilyticaceae bacterium]
MIVKVGVEASNQYEVMKCIAQIAAEAGYVTDEYAFLEALLQREKEGTTGFGYGVAMPHGRCQAVQEAGLVICKLKQPVGWRAIDDAPVTFVIGITIPEAHHPDDYLGMISRLARAMMNQDFLEDIKASEDADSIKQKVMEVMQ